MTKESLAKSGITFASALKGIGWIELLGTLFGGIILMVNAKVPGGYEGYIYKASQIDDAVIFEGIAVIVAGVVSFVICLALAYLCESAAALHEIEKK